MLKTLNCNNKNSLKTLIEFLDKRKTIQKNQTSFVKKIIKNVKKKKKKKKKKFEKKIKKNEKKKGDKAV
mgnify:CR=1 FL=1